MKRLFIMVVVICFNSSPGRAGQQSWIYIVHNSDLSSRYLANTLPKYNVVSITGFTINNNGSISQPGTRVYKDVASIANKHSITVYPLITFRNTTAGHTVLNSMALCSTLTNNISKLVINNQYKGIHLDFEYLPVSDNLRLKHFLLVLKDKLPDIKISMAIFPQIDFPTKWSQFHDLSLLSPCLDEIVIMCYDYHGTHSGPGPVTDIQWAEKNIKAALRFMQPHQIWLGIPAYGYVWYDNKPKVISAMQGTKLSQQYKTQRDLSQTNKIIITKQNHTSIGFYSDKYTRLALKKLADQYNLTGTALWRLGLED